MAVNNALHTHTGGTDAQHARLAQAGLIAVQGPLALDARTGVLWGPGSTTLVTGTSATGQMTVAIAAHHWVTSRSAAGGPYLGVLEAATEVPVAPAPGSGSRVDAVYSKQADSTVGVSAPDAATAPEYGVVTGIVGQGKPQVPVGAIEIATVTVSAGATQTNGPNVVISQTARQTVARGARIPVRNQAERDALIPFRGLEVYRLDNGRIELCTSAGPPAVWATTFTPTDEPVAVLTGTNVNAPSGAHADWTTMPMTVADVDTSNGLTEPGYTVRRDGYYTVSGVSAFAANTAGRRGSRLGLTPAATGVFTSPAYWQAFTPAYSGSAVTASPTVSMALHVGDVLRVQGYQDSGAALALRPDLAMLSVAFVRPL